MKKSALALSLVALAAVTYPASAKNAEDFVKDAIQGDISEVMLGKLAARSGNSQDVKDLGRMLVKDHTKAKAEAVKVAHKMHVTPPTHAMVAADAEYAKLQVLTGDSFDKEFVWYMVKDHQADITEFEEQAKADDGAASKLATKQLPTLKHHLEMVQALTAKYPAN